VTPVELPRGVKLEAGTRPQLAKRARLRLDRKTDQYVLLYPEKGLLLNATGAAIAKRCTGALSVAEIVAELGVEYPSQPQGDLEREVFAFLGMLAERGLLVELEPA